MILKKTHFFIAISFLIIIDQIVKKLIINYLVPEKAIDFIGKAIRLNYVTNTGSAFSLRTK